MKKHSPEIKYQVVIEMLATKASVAEICAGMRGSFQMPVLVPLSMQVLMGMVRAAMEMPVGVLLAYD